MRGEPRRGLFLQSEEDQRSELVAAQAELRRIANEREEPPETPRRLLWRRS